MSDTPTAGRRRGPRVDGSDTREAILQSARAAFSQQGYAATSVRGVARDAGVDPSLVHHFFGSKQGLFAAAIELPLNPRPVIEGMFAAGLDGAGERLVATVLEVWEDPRITETVQAMLRTALSPDAGRRPESPPLVAELLESVVQDAIGSFLPADERATRTALVASQVLGMLVGRFVLRVEPLASLPTAVLVANVGSTVQRYLDGPLGP